MFHRGLSRWGLSMGSNNGNGETSHVRKLGSRLGSLHSWYLAHNDRLGEFGVAPRGSTGTNGWRREGFGKLRFTGAIGEHDFVIRRPRTQRPLSLLALVWFAVLESSDFWPKDDHWALFVESPSRPGRLSSLRTGSRVDLLRHGVRLINEYEASEMTSAEFVSRLRRIAER